MSDPAPPEHKPEIIVSDRVIRGRDVGDVDLAKVRASVIIVYCSLGIAAAVLIFSICAGDSDLKAWASGLISSIAGAALAYGFVTKGGSK
jgi:hypothetical protein